MSRAARSSSDVPTAAEIFRDSALSRPFPYAARAMRQTLDGTPPEDLSGLDKTDAAAVRRFAFDAQGGLCFDWRVRQWRLFDGHRWQLDADGAALRRLQEHLEHRMVTAIADARTQADKLERLRFLSKQLGARQIKALLDLAAAQDGLARRGDEFDRDPLLFACANGVIDLRDGTFREGRPDDWMTLQSPVMFDDRAGAPRFLQALEEIFEPHGAELVPFLQRWAGYLLTGQTREQVFCCLHGRGANGKSLIVSLLMHVLGEYALTLPFASFTGSSDRGATPDLVRLPGRRLVVASESNLTGRFDEGRLKVLTGEDQIAARPLYGSMFEFRSAAKLMFLFNDRPRVTDSSHAFWRRVLLVPFERQFGPDERDPQLKATLTAEAPGILNWMIQGALLWQRDGLCPPPCVLSAVASWRADEDALAEFVQQGCDRVAGHRVLLRDLYAAYLRWCTAERVAEAERIPRKAFTRRVQDFAPKARGKQGDFLVGLLPKAELCGGDRGGDW